MGVFDAGDHLRGPSSNHILQARQFFEGAIDFQKLEVLRLVALKAHPTISKSFQHILEQRTIAPVALPQSLRHPLAFADVLLHPNEMGDLSPRAAHGGDGRLVRAEFAIFAPVDEFPLPDPAGENGFP